jgi:hypothetical protein
MVESLFVLESELPQLDHRSGVMWRFVESAVVLALAVCDVSRQLQQQQQHHKGGATMQAAGELLLHVERWLCGGGRCSASMPESFRSALRAAGIVVTVSSLSINTSANNP